MRIVQDVPAGVAWHDPVSIEYLGCLEYLVSLLSYIPHFILYEDGHEVLSHFSKKNWSEMLSYLSEPSKKSYIEVCSVTRVFVPLYSQPHHRQLYASACFQEQGETINTAMALLQVEEGLAMGTSRSRAGQLNAGMGLDRKIHSASILGR